MAFSGLSVVFRIGSRKLSTPIGVQTAFRSVASASASYKDILVEKKGEKQNVGVITLNRPKSLNALYSTIVSELLDAVERFDSDASVAAVVITGSGKAFAAGADIKEMSSRTFSQNVTDGFLEQLNFSKIKKPIIAAVNGFALGGGCELAMMCDIIYAGEKARFAQPEITLGTIPGAGGTQRIIRSCGKSKAMEICLTGEHFSAQEAEKMGLVSKVFPDDQVVAEAIKLGEKIGKFSPLTVLLCKECVNTGFETTLQEGLRHERRVFHGTFATEDQKEGMAAFIEKRKPNFQNK